MTVSTETSFLRDMARKYLDICHDPQQQTLRELWRGTNSLENVRPLIYLMMYAIAWREVYPQARTCSDPVLRGIEEHLRGALYHASLSDDTIFEPWYCVKAVHKCTDWGVEIPYHHTDSRGSFDSISDGSFDSISDSQETTEFDRTDSRGSYKVDYSLRQLKDIEKLRMPWHEIDEAATAERYERVADAIGDVLPVYIDRGPAFASFHDISTQMGFFRGIENFMLDMYDNPEWLHRLAAFLGTGILAVHEQAEAAGDFGLCNVVMNQAMAYSRELPDPAGGVLGVKRKDLWWFLAAQEFTLISPAMHEEFLLQYQMPILTAFGLVEYGCCEDLSEKIDILRQIPNLRRIAVTPMANVRRCAEQIAQDYVLSYRPSPTDMVGYGWDEDRVRRILRADFAAMAGTHFDITLKDVETVQGDPDRIRKWVAVVREELSRADLV